MRSCVAARSGFEERSSVAVIAATEQYIRGLRNDQEDQSSAPIRMVLSTVAPALRTIDGVGFGGVADVTTIDFLPFEPEARLVFRPVDDER
jgi:hypothetical protein